jgi:hypothetical protein
MQWYRKASVGVLLVVSVLCALVAHAVPAHAANEIQLIRLNNQSFFVPKSWMARHTVIAERATDGGGSKGRWSEPQAEPIDATELTFLGPDQNAAILRDWTDPLPSLILISSYRDEPRDFSGLLPETKKWLDVAASQPPDADGFVRVWPDFAKPGEQPPDETFVYKGYLNEVGQPLVIFSTNLPLLSNFNAPGTHQYPSDAFIAVKRDLRLRYKFSNERFPENTWWDLYQHTLAFLEYLQKPK